MITIVDGEVYYDDRERYSETCAVCGAVGHGNLTCRTCVSQWPRFGIPQDTVDKLLKALGDRLPDPPIGTSLQ